MSNFEVILCIVNNGFSDFVMNVAKKYGARGGTVISGRGTAAKDAEKFFNITIQPEKEIVLILVNNKIAKPSTEIKVGDIITINYYKKTMEVKVKSITPSVKKDEALEMYEIINIIENKGEDYGN